MAEETVPICRLCLEVVYDGRFQEAESIIIILQNVLPNLNFSISSHPLICSKCTETLQKSFNFKSACVDTEKHLQNYQSNGSSVIHLEEVVHNKCLEKEVKMEKVDKGKICRFCLQILEGELSIPLGVIEQDMLGKCLPELDLTVSENPVICQTCLECLQNQFNFVMSCSDVEERIENYCSTQGTNSDGQVNLQDVLLVLPLKMHKVKFDRNDTCNGLKDVKVELENNSSSNIEQSNMEYDEIFIKDEVSTESGHDNLDFSDGDTSRGWLDAYNINSSYNLEKPSYELDHDYVSVNPSLTNGLSRHLSKRYKMKHFIKPSKDTQTISALKKTIVRLQKKLKCYEAKYRKASEKLNYIKCLLQELKKKKLISEEAYLEIMEYK